MNPGQVSVLIVKHSGFERHEIWPGLNKFEEPEKLDSLGSLC